jgi:hypothetical protein
MPNIQKITPIAFGCASTEPLAAETEATPAHLEPFSTG